MNDRGDGYLKKNSTKSIVHDICGENEKGKFWSFQYIWYTTAEYKMNNVLYNCMMLQSNEWSKKGVGT